MKQLLAWVCVLPLAGSTYAAPTWSVDLNNSSLNLNGDTYADNGAHGFRPAGPWDEDSLDEDTFQANFVVGPDTFDLGASVNPISRDRDLSVPYDTSASAVSIVTIHGVGSNTLEIAWRANTFNDQFDGDGFLSTSEAHVFASILARIDGVSPGTPVSISYEWEYFATAVPDHEGVGEDPEQARGSLSLIDNAGGGPGNLFDIMVGEPGPAPLTDFDDDIDSHNLVTGVPDSFLTIDLAASSITAMESPGDGLFDEDLAGSEFIGTLTLVIVPEPAVGTLLIGGLGLLAKRRR